MCATPEVTTTPLSYATDIKPLFRPKDRNNMIGVFDLWNYDDVKQYAQPIYQHVEDGSMPCDGAWPPEKVDTFKLWMDQGMNP